VSELPADVRDLLAELKDLQSVGGNPIDLLLSSLPADTARWLRLCAIPHTFSPTLLTVIEPGLSKEDARTKCAELAELAVVRRVADRFALHDDARVHLFRGWLFAGGPDFKAVSGRLAAYFAEDANRHGENREAAEEAHLRMVFHRIGADQGSGMEAFGNVSRTLRYSLRPAVRERLLALVEEYTSVLSPPSLRAIRYEHGKLAADTRRWEAADKIFQDLLADDGDDLALKVKVHGRLAIAAAARRNWDVAIEHLQEARRILERVGDGLPDPAARDVMVARILIGLGIAWREKRNYAEAAHFLESGMLFAQRTGSPHLRAHAFNARGQLHASTGDRDRAIEDYRASLALLEGVGDTLGAANVVNNIAIEYLNSENWGESRGYLERSLRIKEESEDAAGQAAVLNNLARLERRARAERRAIQHFERAARLFEEVRDYFNAAVTLRNLARCHQSINEIEAYKRRLVDARQFFERASASQEVANVDIELRGATRSLTSIIVIAVALLIFIVGVIAIAELSDTD